MELHNRDPNHTPQEESHTVIIIDGQLMLADLGEIRRVRESAKGNVLLKLGGLNGCVDEGIRVLRDWLNAGARLDSATPFLQIMLEKRQNM
jgi:hypothetical protein